MLQHSPTKRLLIGFAITLLAAILYSGYTLRQVRMLRALQTETVDRNRKDSLQLLRIQNSLNSLAVSFRDMLSGEDPYPLAAYEPQVRRIRADLEDALRTEDTLLPHAGRSAQQHSVASALKAFWQGADSMFALAREHHEPQAREMLRGPLQSQETALTAMIARLLVENNSSEEQATGSIHQIYDRVERNLYGFLLAELLAILATSMAMVYFNRRIFQSLESLSAQKTTLARKLIGVQEEVLRSVSRELHDEFGQILTAIGTLLARAERKAMPPDSPLREALHEVQQITQETLEKTRTLSHALHPGILDDYGLEKAIEWYVPMFQKQTGIEVSYRKQGDGSAVPERAAIHVYRILQEALNNVARHAQSKSAEVRVNYGARRLELQIEDRGIGLPDHKSGQFTGLGLVAMRERADLLNATLKVENAACGGAIVTLDVPIDDHSEDNASI